MRTIPLRKPGTRVDYVPESFDNREDPEPVTVSLVVPSKADRQELDGANPYASGADVTHEQALAWRHLLLRRFVAGVRNYRLEDLELATAEDLVLYGEELLENEVAAEIMRMLWLTVGQVKHSAGSFDSSPQMTRQADGTAASVESSGSTDPATAVARTRTPTSNTSLAQA